MAVLKSDCIADPLQSLFKALIRNEIMGALKKYFIVVESEHPPQVILEQNIPNIGTVIEIKTEQLPNRVDAAWLQERFNISRKALIEKLRIFNKGTDTKHLYDPKEVIPILENLNVTNKRGAHRKK